MPAKYYVDDEYGRRSVQSLDEDQARALNAKPVKKDEKSEVKPAPVQVSKPAESASAK